MKIFKELIAKMKEKDFQKIYKKYKMDLLKK